MKQFKKFYNISEKDNQCHALASQCKQQVRKHIYRKQKGIKATNRNLQLSRFWAFTFIKKYIKAYKEKDN